MGLRLLVAATALLGALLAGCLGGTTDTTDSTTTLPTAGPLRFAAPVAGGAKVGEPGLVLTNDTIWVHAPHGLWKSLDDGATFEEVPVMNEVVCSGPTDLCGGDSELTIASDGTLYFSDLQTLVSISSYTSTDDGESWFYNPDASVVPGDDRQWMATGPDAGPLAGDHHAAYLVFNHLLTNVFLSKSTDGGVTWVGKNVVLDTPQTQFWSMGNIIVDQDDGAIYLVYALGNALTPFGDGQIPIEYEVRMSSSTDGGLTWSHHTVVAPDLTPGHIFPVIAQDESDNLFVAWAQEMPDHVEIQMASSSDKGATWSTPMRVNQHEGTTVMPWIDASGDGQVVVAWYGSTETVHPSVVEGDWHVYVAQSKDALAASPVFTEEMAWAEAIHQGGICTTGITCGLPGGRPGSRALLDFFQVKLDDAGRAHMVFADTTHEEGTTVYYAQQSGGPLLPRIVGTTA